MKKITTITLDNELKEKAIPIIRNEMYSSLSQQVNLMLRELINKNPGAVKC